MVAREEESMVALGWGGGGVVLHCKGLMGL